MVSEGQRLFGTKPGAFLLATLLSGLALLLAVSPLMGMGALEELELPPLLELPVSILCTAGIQLAGGGGALWVSALGLRAARGREVDLKAGLADALQVLAPALVVGLIVDKLSSLGMLFCLLPGFMILSMLAFGQLFVLDKRLGPFAALQASARVTAGSRWTVLVLVILYLLVLLVGFLALGIGLLAAFPIGTLAWVAAYERLWPAAGPNRSVSPGRRGCSGMPAPEPAAACPSCQQAVEGEVRTCVGCGSRYHAGCRSSYCLQTACPQSWPVHPDWTREERACGPWVEVPARPTPQAWFQVSLGAVLLTGVVSDSDSVRSLLVVLVSALPERWMGVSASVALVLVPWAALLLLAWHQHRSYRSVLIDRRGLLLDWSPDWPGTRASWAQVLGFELDEDGVWLRLRGRLRPAVLLALPEAERGKLVELLEEKQLPRLDA